MFIAALLSTILKYQLVDSNSGTNAFAVLQQTNLQNDPSCEMIQELIMRLFNEVFEYEESLFERPLMHSTINGSYCESETETINSVRRQSLSETLNSLNSSLNDSPAMAKTHKRKGIKLHEQMMRDGEIENEVLGKENDELNDRLNRITAEHSRLQCQLSRQSDYEEVKKENEQLQDEIHKTEENKQKLKKVMKENESLKDKLQAEREAKYNAQYLADDLKNKTTEMQIEISRLEAEVKESQSRVLQMKTELDEAERLKSQEEAFIVHEQPHNESINDSSRLSCEPPSFSKLNHTGTPNFQLEMDLENAKDEISRLKIELENSEVKKNEIKAVCEEIKSSLADEKAINSKITDRLANTERERNDALSKANEIQSHKEKAEAELTSVRSQHTQLASSYTQLDQQKIKLDR